MGKTLRGSGTPRPLNDGLEFPPNQIDLLNTISGVTFAEAWKDRISENLLIQGQRIEIRYIGLAALIKNKKAVGRPKDLEDLKYLREAAKKG